MENETQTRELEPQDFFDARARRQGTATSQGTMNAESIENARPITIPNAPEPVVSNRVITDTVIPPEQPEQSPAPDVSNEATELRTQISERQDILEELGLGDIQTSFEDLMGKGAFTAGAEEDAGIDDKTVALNDINNQLREKDLRFRRDREAIEDEVGLTKGQKNQSIANLSRRQSRELADLSVIQSSRINDLATTQALVDRKVELQFEPIQQKLELQRFMFEENKDLFNSAESRQFEKKVREEQVKIDKDKFKFQQLENAKLEIMNNINLNGGTNELLASVQSAKDLGTAYKTAGRFGNDPVVKAQLANIYSQIGSRNAVKSDEIIEMPEQTGTPSVDIANVIDATGAKSTQSMTNAVNVITGVQQFVSGSEGEFAGIAPIRTPNFLLGDTTRAEKQENVGNIEALNLKVQQWASGAALTDKQTAQVARLVPDRNDTDRQVRNKSNQLVNYMMGQVQGELAGQGINYEPAKVDFFNEDPLDVGTITGDNDPLGVNS